MCKQYLNFACAVLVLYLAECAPPPFQICKREDSKCIKESSVSFKAVFVKGIPEYNVEKLDPLQIKSINASEGNLLFLLNDVTLNGLKNCDIQKIYRNAEKSVITLKMQCSATLDGDYILKGQVLVVPIEGKGKIHADLRSALFNVDFDMGEKVGEDGKKHWHIKSFHHTFDLKEKSDVVFEDLFKGNELLARAATDLIANNGNDVIKEIGLPVITYVINRIVKNVNHMFKVIPAEDLSLS